MSSGPPPQLVSWHIMAFFGSKIHRVVCLLLRPRLERRGLGKPWHIEIDFPMLSVYMIVCFASVVFNLMQAISHRTPLAAQAMPQPCKNKNTLRISNKCGCLKPQSPRALASKQPPTCDRRAMPFICNQDLDRRDLLVRLLGYSLFSCPTAR